MGMTARRVLLGAAGDSEQYWIASLSSGGNAIDVDYDTLGNTYAVGNWSNPGGGYLAKWSQDGSLLTHVGMSVYGSSGDTQGIPAAVMVAKDGTGDVVAGVGSTASNGTYMAIRTPNTLATIKGSIVMGGMGNYRYYNDSATCTDGTSYHSWIHGDGEYQGIVVHKQQTNGYQAWALQIYGYNFHAPAFGGLCVDPSNNLMLVMRVANNDEQTESLAVWKLNPSGTALWKFRYNTDIGWPPLGANVGGVCCDPSGDLFITHGGYEIDGIYRGYLTKINGSTGARIWTVKFRNGDNTDVQGQWGRLQMNPSGTVLYALNTTWMVALNPANGAAYHSYNFGFAVRGFRVSNSSLYLAGYAGNYGSERHIVAKVPLDGSRGGSYVLGGVTINYVGKVSTTYTAVTVPAGRIGNGVTPDQSIQTVSGTTSGTPALLSRTATNAKVTI